MNDEVKKTFTPSRLISFRSSRKTSRYIVRAELYPLKTCAHLGFSEAGVQTLEKGQINIKRKRNEYNSYIGDNFLIIRSYKINKIR